MKKEALSHLPVFTTIVSVHQLPKKFFILSKKDPRFW